MCLCVPERLEWEIRCPQVEIVVSKPIFPLVPELQAVVRSVPAQVQCQGAHRLAKQPKPLVSEPENLSFFLQ